MASSQILLDRKTTIDLAVWGLKERNLTITEVIHELIKVYSQTWCVNAYSINCGLCEDFAWSVCEVIDGAEAYWGNELCTEEETEYEFELYGCHCFVEYEGRYYDSESPDGEDNFRDLRCFAEQRIP